VEKIIISWQKIYWDFFGQNGKKNIFYKYFVASANLQNRSPFPLAASIHDFYILYMLQKWNLWQKLSFLWQKKENRYFFCRCSPPTCSVNLWFLIFCTCCKKIGFSGKKYLFSGKKEKKYFFLQSCKIAPLPLPLAASIYDFIFCTCCKKWFLWRKYHFFGKKGKKGIFSAKLQSRSPPTCNVRWGLSLCRRLKTVQKTNFSFFKLYFFVFWKHILYLT